tara:strand:- start:517 stop:2154 length:1638 start_codon:yes stop_codon:yes gene_type:complete
MSRNDVKTEQILSLKTVDITAQTAPNFKILYDNDLVNIAYGSGSWLKPNPDILTKEEIKKRIEKSVEEVSSYKNIAHFFRPGFGHIPFWKSDVYSAKKHYESWESKTGNTASSWGKYMMDDKNYGDLLKVFVDEAQKNNQSPFVSLLLNDIHHGYQNKINELNISKEKWSEKSEWISNFIIENKSYLNDSTNFKSGLNWSNIEVRNLRLEFIKEICENYEIDGIELDFMRYPRFFTDNVPVTERIRIISDFLTEVDSLLNDPELRPDNYPKNKKRFLVIRIPAQEKMFNELGLDYSKFKKNGVDMVILSTYFFSMQQGIDFKFLRNSIPNLPIYYELHYITLGYSIDSGLPYYGRIPATEAQLYTTANLVYKNGFDGISLYNFQYYKNTFNQNVPFSIIDSLADKSWVSNFKPQWYFRSEGWRDEVLPEIFNSKKTVNYKLDTIFQENLKPQRGEFRLFFDSDIEGENWRVFINTKELSKVDCIFDPNQKTFEQFTYFNSKFLCYDIQRNLIENGTNNIKLSYLPSEANVEKKLIYYDLILKEYF